MRIEKKYYGNKCLNGAESTEFYLTNWWINLLKEFYKNKEEKYLILLFS